MQGVFGTDGSMPVLRHVVTGTPKSVQADRKRRSRWRDRVAASVKDVYLAEPIGSDVELRIVYVHSSEVTDIDVDNIIKPIADALISVVYDDDRQISDVRCSRRSMHGVLQVRDGDTAVLDAVNQGDDFILLEVLEPPDPGAIP